MAHEIAKLILEHAESVADQKTAVEKAFRLGMPFTEIEDYLDWLDARNAPVQAEKLKQENQILGG